MGWTTDTNYRRKLLFNEILSAQLATSAFRVDAVYESAAREQVASVRCFGEQTVRLGINLSFKTEAMFAGCADPLVPSIAFRAYSIVQYIRCLESAKGATPSSLFAGWVTLDAIGDRVLGNKQTLCVPNAYGVNILLRPMDVHCAIRAMTSVLIQYEDTLPNEVKQRCQAYIDTLITYTGMPEVTYTGSTQPCYTVVCEVKRLAAVLARVPEAVQEYAVFHQVGFTALDALDVTALLDRCDQAENTVWPAVILRLSAVTHTGLLSHPALERSYASFCENGVAFCSEQRADSVLLRDTRRAMQQLVRETASMAESNTLSGRVHDIR